MIAIVGGRAEVQVGDFRPLEQACRRTLRRRSGGGLSRVIDNPAVLAAAADQEMDALQKLGR